MSQVGETVPALQAVDLRAGGHVAGMAVVAGYEPTVTIYSRPTQVATHASLPSGSARTHNIGACASETKWPPAVRA